MESQIRNENVETNANTETTRAYNFDNPPPSKYNHGLLVIFTVRSIAIILTFVSAIILGAAKETVVASNSTMYGGIIKSTQFPAYVYFTIANVVVLLYSIASLVLLFANRIFLSRIAVPLSIGDLIMVVLLFSCNGAAATASIISDIGQPNIAWNNICSDVVKFCASVKASIVLSMFAGVIYLLLVVHALVGNQKRLQSMGLVVDHRWYVYSYAILLLEMFAGVSPTDERLSNGLSLHKQVEMVFPEQVMNMVDNQLFSQIDREDDMYASEISMIVCLVSVIQCRLQCSKDSPKERISIKDAAKMLNSSRTKLFRPQRKKWI